MEIGIVAQRDNERATALAGDVRDALAAEDVSARLDPATAEALGLEGEPVEAMADAPFVVSVGGDGTFLYVARRVGPTPVMGVNLGEVGFLNAVSPAEATDRVLEAVERVRAEGAPVYREVPRLRASGDGWSLSPGLNEVAVLGRRRGRGQGIDVEVGVDGRAYADTHADGVLVATPTGSTAYNMSEGGPLVHPSVDGLVVNGMASAEPRAPLVVDRQATVTVRASGADRAMVASDGSERRWVELPATVTVRVDEEPGRIAGPRSDFFAALEKLR